MDFFKLVPGGFSDPIQLEQLKLKFGKKWDSETTVKVRKVQKN